jgi:hypothetical protein
MLFNHWQGFMPVPGTKPRASEAPVYNLDYQAFQYTYLLVIFSAALQKKMMAGLKFPPVPSAPLWVSPGLYSDIAGHSAKPAGRKGENPAPGTIIPPF